MGIGFPEISLLARVVTIKASEMEIVVVLGKRNYWRQASSRTLIINPQCSLMFLTFFPFSGPSHRLHNCLNNRRLCDLLATFLLDYFVV